MPTADRDETPAERADRNWTELLQELRVTQTGIQVLAGFLLTLPFQQRFSQLSHWQTGQYLAAVSCAVISVILLVAPVSAHRWLFRRHEKDVVVTFGDRLAKAGLTMLAVTIVLTVFFVFGVVAGQSVGATAAGVAAAAFIALWAVLPGRHVR
ncbi:DUF6328 family protein [Flexivirga lutea]